MQIYDVVGERRQAASYYVGSKDLQTVNINLAGVTGNVIIQATLATLPETTDWFNVYEIQANTTFINEAVNVEGNFVWMRAKVQDFAAGVVQYVKLSY